MIRSFSSGVVNRLSNEIKATPALVAKVDGIERIADVPIYRTDAMVRRSEPLQQTPASTLPTARMNADTFAQLQLVDGDQVRVKSAQGEISLTAQVDNTIAANSVRIAAAFAETAALGSAFGQLTVERV